MLTKDEQATALIFSALQVGIEGAADAFPGTEISDLFQGDGFHTCEITIDGNTYEIHVSAKRRAVA